MNNTELTPERSLHDRYIEAQRNYSCIRRDFAKYNARKAWFHLKGLIRAILGL